MPIPVPVPITALCRSPRALWVIAICSLLLTACNRKPEPQTPHPYDETANVAAVLNAAFERAGNHKAVLIVFGANWCPECRKLDAQLVAPPLSSQLAEVYEVVKIDIGRFNRNTVAVNAYGNPSSKGIPAIAIAKVPGQPLRVIDSPVLSKARKSGHEDLWEVLRP